MAALLLAYAAPVGALANEQAHEIASDITSKIDIPTQPSHPKEVIEWQVISAALYQNHILEVKLSVKSSGGFHLYQNRVQFTPPTHTTLIQTSAPTTKDLLDPVTGKMVDVYGSGVFELIFQVDPDYFNDHYGSGKSLTSSELSVTYLGCSLHLCLLPYTEFLSLDVLAMDHDYELMSSQDPPMASIQSAPDHLSELSEPISLAKGFSLDHLLARQLTTHGSSLLWLLILSLLGGLLTNLTPCVYPMIPITLRALSGPKGSALSGSVIYASGIFSMYTLLGSVAALSGSLLGGASASLSFNLILAAFLTWMSLSMLGYGQMTFLQQLGNKIGGSSGASKQVFLMGLSAGFVAAPCTGPVLAGLMSYAFSHLSVVGSLGIFSAYSFGFAAPYVVIGPVIQRLVKRPSRRIHASVLILVKILMAAMILALALYYLRIPFYSFTKEVSSQTWLVITVVLGATAIIMTTITVTHKKWQYLKSYQLGPTIALSISLFAFTQLLGTRAKSDIHWLKNPDIHQVLSEDASPRLIALWAEWCTACKVMETTTFRDPLVVAYLESKDIKMMKYDVTQMTSHDQNSLEMLGVRGLPAYVMLRDKSDKPNMTKAHTKDEIANPNEATYDRNTGDKARRNKKGSVSRQKNLHGLYEPSHFLKEIQAFY